MRGSRAYQNYLLHRFQIIPLTLLVVSDVIVITRMIDLDSTSLLPSFLVFLFIMLYLFGNRVGDDKRDFDFDAEFYPDRAVQKGAITLNQLERLSQICIVGMAGIAIFFGWYSMLLVGPVILFSWWAKKDFSLPIYFKDKFFFQYNILNMLQMLALQIFVYAAALGSLEISLPIWTHVAFVFALSLQIEVTRKIKVNRSPGNDMYSDRLGMKGALILWGFIGLMCVTLSSILMNMLGVALLWVLVLGGTWTAVMLLGAMAYGISKKESLENLFWAATIGVYIGQNIAIAYA